jgi:hypothetical protein
MRKDVVSQITVVSKLAIVHDGLMPDENLSITLESILADLNRIDPPVDIFVAQTILNRAHEKVAPADLPSLDLEWKLWAFHWTDLGPISSLPSTHPAKDPLTLSHLDKRLAEVTSPWLRARYFHFKWYVHRHTDFANAAIKAYLETLVLLSAIHDRKETKDIDEAEPTLTWLSHAKSVVEIATTSRQQRDLVLQTVHEQALRWHPHHAVGQRVLSDWSEQYFGGSLFSPEQRSEWANYLATCFKGFLPTGQLHAAEVLREILERLEGSLERDLSKTRANKGHLLAASAFVRLALDDGIAGSDAESAAHAYREASQSDLERLMLSLHEQLRGHQRLTPIQVDLTHQIRIASASIEILANGPLETFLSEVATTSIVIPDQTAIDAIEIQTQELGGMITLLSTTVIDTHGNSAGVLSSEETFRTRRYSQMRLKFHSTLPGFNLALNRYTDQDMFEIEQILAWLRAGPLVQTVERHKPGGEPITEDWIALLTPGLRVFTNAIQNNLPDGDDAWVLALDSLTPKLEGLLRRRLELATTPVTRVQANTPHGLTEAQLLTGLLADPNVVTELGRDTVEFLKYIIGDRLGMNLRNDISHGLASLEDYSRSTALLVFLGILRLAR